MWLIIVGYKTDELVKYGTVSCAECGNERKAMVKPAHVHGVLPEDTDIKKYLWYLKQQDPNCTFARAIKIAEEGVEYHGSVSKH